MESLTLLLFYLSLGFALNHNFRILVNDGAPESCLEKLRNSGFLIDNTKIDHYALKSSIAKYDILLVRSATKVDESVLNGADNLKLIARAGNGLDNIDLECAKSKGIIVINTPTASSRSVAEMVFSHLFTVSRNLQTCNGELPKCKKENNFLSLKKQASSGFELEGKKIGIIGFGSIGKEVAKIAIGLGMKILVFDYKQRDFILSLFIGNSDIKVEIKSQSLQSVLTESDIITVNTPGNKEIIGENEFKLMKPGMVLINCARGGVVNENSLLDALSTGLVKAAGIDVFVHEPPEDYRLLSHPLCSVSPHIGAGTVEAQGKVYTELVNKIIQFTDNYNKN